jgi:hypothetical protein
MPDRFGRVELSVGTPYIARTLDVVKKKKAEYALGDFKESRLTSDT